MWVIPSARFHANAAANAETRETCGPGAVMGPAMICERLLQHQNGAEDTCELKAAPGGRPGGTCKFPKSGADEPT